MFYIYMCVYIYIYMMTWYDGLASWSLMASCHSAVSIKDLSTGVLSLCSIYICICIYIYIYISTVLWHLHRFSSMTWELKVRSSSSQRPLLKAWIIIQRGSTRNCARQTMQVIQGVHTYSCVRECGGGGCTMRARAVPVP